MAMWLPWSCTILHNKGGEIIGSLFQWLLEMFSIKDDCSISKKLQSNATWEWMHQTVGNVLQTLVHTNPLQIMNHARNILNDELPTALHAIWTTVTTTFSSCLSSLAFSQDMFLNVLQLTTWHTIRCSCEYHANENLQNANRKCCQHEYVPT